MEDAACLLENDLRTKPQDIQGQCEVEIPKLRDTLSKAMLNLHAEIFKVPLEDEK